MPNCLWKVIVVDDGLPKWSIVQWKMICTVKNQLKPNRNPHKTGNCQVKSEQPLLIRRY